MFTDPTHCPVAHSFAMTHHFNFNFLYLEAQNYGPYQAKDRTCFAINNIFCNNIMQLNLKISTDVISILHYTPIINSLTSVFPTIHSLPDISISPCTYICTYICMYVSKPMYFVRPKIQLQLKIRSFQIYS